MTNNIDNLPLSHHHQIPPPIPSGTDGTEIQKI